MEIAIIGAGKLGIKVTESLLSGNYSITLVDKDEDILNKVGNQLDVMPLNIDARDVNALKRMGIKDFDYLLAVTGDDQTNMVVASFAKKLGCKKVIARVREPEYMKHFEFIKETFNIDYVVNPDLSITTEIYKYLVEKYTLSNGIFTSGSIGIIEFKAARIRNLEGKSIPDVKALLPDMLIAAISRNGRVIIPHGGDVIQYGDSLYVVGEKEKIRELNKKVHVRGKYTDIQKVMIIGGGKTGYYLADKLAEFGIAVKLVEKDKARCRYLSTHMPDVMVLHGDGTDVDMLEEENFGEMDAFVTATGYDEENLLLALTAKNRGIEDVISKVSRESYSDLIERMGIDMVLNPLDITAGNIFGYIKESKVVVSSVIIQGQAEVIEVIANGDMSMIDIPLSKLELPKGMIVAAIHRGREVIIPDGETRIQLNDRIMIFSLLREISDLEKLLKNKR